HESDAERIINSVNCDAVRVWAPHFQLGTAKSFDAVDDDSWVLFANPKVPIVVRELMAMTGRDVLCEMDGSELSITFPAPARGGDATIQVPNDTSITAMGWQAVGMPLQRQHAMTAEQELVIQMEDIKSLRLHVAIDAMNEPLVFPRE